MSRFASTTFALAALAAPSLAHATLIVTPTTSGSALAAALVPNQVAFSGLTAAYTYGNASQVGTFSGFTGGVVALPQGGVVLSTGLVSQTTAAFHSNGDVPSTDLSGGSTPEITAYGPGHVTNFNAAHDAARVTISFTLATASAIAFDFAFGTVEYPDYTNNYTDAAYAFLDGNQITFDTNGNAVQVGTSFASALTSSDQTTAFYSPHGLLGPLTTTSATLAAGAHTLQIEVADTNDGILDSALFVSDLRLSTNDGGPTTGSMDGTNIPEPASALMLGTLVIGWKGVRRRLG